MRPKRWPCSTTSRTLWRRYKTLCRSASVAARPLAVDSVSGATATSQGLLAAVKDCLLQAGADEAALYAPVARSTQTETYECDVVVVGGGTSGSAAAAKAAQSGARVILVEKSGRLGGTAPCPPRSWRWTQTSRRRRDIPSIRTTCLSNG